LSYIWAHLYDSDFVILIMVQIFYIF